MPSNPGGTFDIAFEIKDPKDKNLLDGAQERQGDYVLTANSVGEYSFCFTNDIGTLAEKLIDFDIMVESEPRREPATKPGQLQDHSSALEESIFRLNGQLLSVKRTQKLYVACFASFTFFFECFCWRIFVVNSLL